MASFLKWVRIIVGGASTRNRLDPARIKPLVSSDDNSFDVFFAYHNNEFTSVAEIYRLLFLLGIRPWIDVREIRPGYTFQSGIQHAMKVSKSFAVFVGPSGIGQYQALEIQAIITEFVETGRPVIPVLLPGVSELPENLLFLKQFNRVAFHTLEDDEALQRLAWGITGRRLSSYEHDQSR